jgi:hypothetical protein
MNKNKLLKLKRSIFSIVNEQCTDEDSQLLSSQLDKTINDYFNPIKTIQKTKGYLAPTGEENIKIESLVRTKGQSEKADSLVGKGP